MLRRTSDIELVFFWRAFRLLILVLLLVISLWGGINLAQQEGDEQEEALAVPVLEFNTYNCEWLRYKNFTEPGRRKLEIEGLSSFPFYHLISNNKPELADLEAADTLAEQIAQYGEIDESTLAYDGGRARGTCRTDLVGGNYPDVYCVPGTSALPDGYVYLALYHPESFGIVALTTTIDNLGGGAASAGCWDPFASVPTPDPEPTEPAPQDAPAGCGPYAPGQWITVDEYEASGLDLPVSTENTQFPIFVYVCLVPQDNSSYLQAHPLIQPTAKPTPTPTPTPARPKVEEKRVIDCSREPERSRGVFC